MTNNLAKFGTVLEKYNANKFDPVFDDNKDHQLGVDVLNAFAELTDAEKSVVSACLNSEAAETLFNK